MDPNGVKPAPNSAKVLSKHFGTDSPLTDLPGSYIEQIRTDAPYLYGNVGCGFTGTRDAEDQTDCNQLGGGVFDPVCYVGVPAKCPEEKFTYLNSTLFGQVTGNYDPENGLEVELYPGQVLGTSFTTVLKKELGDNVGDIGPSGIQVLRMRYQKDENGARTQPVVGHIHSNPDGLPVFSLSLIHI